uniref:Uncharacterized protein n=1 Tax=Anguilla anguilla TaxID=7936 RepID=A0A0E9W9C3_ANGAN
MSVCQNLKRYLQEIAWASSPQYHRVVSTTDKHGRLVIRGQSSFPLHNILMNCIIGLSMQRNIPCELLYMSSVSK